MVTGRGSSGMEKSPTKCGSVGWRGGPPRCWGPFDSARVKGRESIVVAVAGLDGVRERDESVRAIAGLVFCRDMFELVVIPVLVRCKYGLLDVVSCLDNNPRRESPVSLLDRGYSGIEITLPPSSSNSTFGRVGWNFPRSGVTVPTSLVFSNLNVSFRRRRLSANICVIRLSTL